MTKRWRLLRIIGNSYYIKLEPADLKDYSVKKEEIKKQKVKADISDIEIKYIKQIK